MENNNNLKFSWCYAFFGIFGFFFHRVNMEKRKFWKSAGVDILCWGFVLGVLNKLTKLIPSTTFTDILLTVMIMTLWGFVGAWRFNKYKKENLDETILKRREKYGIISGIIIYSIFTIAYIILIGYANSVSSNIENRTLVYYENGYVCDKFYQVGGANTKIDTNKEVENALRKIHTYCPSDVFTSDTVDVKSIIELYPQLTNWDFNAHFIHTYPTENGNTAYIFIKRVKI